jgi:prefoldin beta subunit
MTSEKVNQLQLMQQNMQNIAVQKQQIQHQIVELNSAINGLKETEKSYRIVGNIMIEASKEDLNKDLEGKKEIAEIRLKNFVKQEKDVQKNLEELQEEVMAELK